MEGCSAQVRGKDVPKLCLLSPETDYPENWQEVAAQYQRLFGENVAFRCWSDASALDDFALVMPLLAWGYHLHPARWFAALDRWEGSGVRFANPVATLRWNTDKDYLFDLEAAGVPIVPTRETHCLSVDDLAAARAAFGDDQLVVKPAISGGAEGTYCLNAGDAIPFSVLEREMLIQPMMPAIAAEGEFSLFYFGGIFSHAILKKPALGDFRVQEQFGGRELSIAPPVDAQTLARLALAAVDQPPVYARVDMVRGGDGAFKLMELELIEPSLFLDHSEDGGRAFADSVFALL